MQIWHRFLIDSCIADTSWLCVVPYGEGSYSFCMFMRTAYSARQAEQRCALIEALDSDITGRDEDNMGIGVGEARVDMLLTQHMIHSR